MIPVDEGNTCLLDTPSSLAVAAQTSLHARIPGVPVAQFAFPELTRTARIRPMLLPSDVRPIVIGVATIRFRVNNAAALVDGTARMRPRSGLPLALIPALTAPKLNP